MMSTENRSAQNDTSASADISADAARAARASILEEVFQSYIRTDRHREVAGAVDRLVDTVTLTGREAGGLFVIGDTGAGKTETVRRVLSELDGLEPEATATTTTKPVLEVEVPSPATLGQLGRAILDGLGYEVHRRLTENETWQVVRSQLETRQVRLLYLDEGQHLTNSADPNEVQKVSNTLKNLMQARSWQVAVIMTGMPDLDGFLRNDRQLLRRVEVIHFERLRMPDDKAKLSTIVTALVCKKAGMSLGFELTDDFLGRFCHATDGHFGTLIQLVQDVIHHVLTADSSARTIDYQHFVTTYRRFAGASDDENVFTVSKWDDVRPALAPPETPTAGTETMSPKKGRKSKGRKKKQGAK